MKVGDLVKMKYIMFWMLKGDRYKTYTEQPLLVMEMYANIVKGMYPNGMLRSDLIEHYEVLSESR